MNSFDNYIDLDSEIFNAELEGTVKLWKGTVKLKQKFAFRTILFLVLHYSAVRIYLHFVAIDYNPPDS